MIIVQLFFVRATVQIQSLINISAAQHQFIQDYIVKARPNNSFFCLIAVTKQFEDRRGYFFFSAMPEQTIKFYFRFFSM